MTPHRTIDQPSPIPRAGIRGLRGILLYVALSVASFIPPLAMAALTESTPFSAAVAEAISICALVLEGFYMTRRKKAKAILVLLVVAGCFLALYTGSVLPTAALISFLFVLSEGALLMAVATPTQLLFIPALPMITFALSTVLGGSVSYGVMGMIPYLPMTALALGTRSAAAKKNGITRVGVICLTSAALGLSLLVVLAYLIYTTYGALNLSILTSLIDQLRNEMTSLLTQLVAAAADRLSAPITDDMITAAVDGTFNLLPAYGVVCCNLAATFAQMIFLNEVSEFHPLNDRLRIFAISPVSCAVFIAGYAVMLFSPSGDPTVSGTVAENLVLILTPALAWAGILHLSLLLARRGDRRGCAPLLMLLVPCLLFIAPVIPAFYEAFFVVTAPLRSLKDPPSDPS